MDIRKLDTGTSEKINVFITSEKGSRSYCELDQKSGTFMLKKVTRLPFPGFYGYIPRTHHTDGEPLDVMVLTSEPISQGIVVQVRPIGVIRLKGSVPDDILIGVLINDKVYGKTQDLLTLNKEELDKLKNFLEELKGKTFQDTLDVAHSKRSFERASELFKREFE
jgi:inorganic pyrophosphatase